MEGWRGEVRVEGRGMKGWGSRDEGGSQVWRQYDEGGGWWTGVGWWRLGREWIWEAKTLGGGAVSMLPLLGMIPKRTSGIKVRVGISNVVKVVADVCEVHGGRPAAEDFYGVVGDSLSGISGGGSYAE